MSDTDVINLLSSKMVLALTLWAEARGEPIEGQIAVGCVIRNRLKNPEQFRASEATYPAICLAPKQFSCWIPNGGEANHDSLMRLARKLVNGASITDVHLKQCLWVAEGIVGNVILDNTGGSTHYYAPAAMIPAGRIPKWAMNKASTPIGSQRFLRA